MPRRGVRPDRRFLAALVLIGTPSEEVLSDVGIDTATARDPRTGTREGSRDGQGEPAGAQRRDVFALGGWPGPRARRLPEGAPTATRRGRQGLTAPPHTGGLERSWRPRKLPVIAARRLLRVTRGGGQTTSDEPRHGPGHRNGRRRLRLHSCLERARGRSVHRGREKDQRGGRGRGPSSGRSAEGSAIDCHRRVRTAGKHLKVTGHRVLPGLGPRPPLCCAMGGPRGRACSGRARVVGAPFTPRGLSPGADAAAVGRGAPTHRLCTAVVPGGCQPR